MKEGKSRKSVNHDQPMEAQGLKQVDPDLFHGASREGEDEGFPWLSRSKGLASVA